MGSGTIIIYMFYHHFIFLSRFIMQNIINSLQFKHLNKNASLLSGIIYFTINNLDHLFDHFNSRKSKAKG